MDQDRRTVAGVALMTAAASPTRTRAVSARTLGSLAAIAQVVQPALAVVWSF
jgi:hypothetical protein